MRPDLLKHNLGCSKCSLCHLPVGILETKNTTQPSGVYAQALKTRWIRNWMAKKRLDSVLAGTLYI